MATNAIQNGKRMTWLNSTGSDVSSNDVVPVEDKICVALADIANGESGALATEEVYQVTKQAGEAMIQGKDVHWDTAQGIATHVSSGNISMGTCWAASASAAVVVNVKLKP